MRRSSAGNIEGSSSFHHEAQPHPIPTSRLVLNVHAFAMPGFSVKGPDLAGAIETSMGPGIGAQVGYAFDGGVMLSMGKFGSCKDPFQEGDLSVDNSMTTRIRVGLDWRP